MPVIGMGVRLGMGEALGTAVWEGISLGVLEGRAVA
jgi:hypothetical protein